MFGEAARRIGRDYKTKEDDMRHQTSRVIDGDKLYDAGRLLIQIAWQRTDGEQEQLCPDCVPALYLSSAQWYPIYEYEDSLTTENYGPADVCGGCGVHYVDQRSESERLQDKLEADVEAMRQRWPAALKVGCYDD